MRVEVVYALPLAHDATVLELAPGATVAEALAASGIAERHPGIDLSRLGIFGRRVGADAPLADGDRVEVYRPLALDPKEARRHRAQRGGSARKR
jgi:putative ubiquitin-RnfH superfamily antitoxin RatB of RatAB toxin-antitoxin module